jgi:ribose transport system ATP-binding protein
LLKLVKVSKTYPGVKALQDVSIDFAAGTVHALLGENGAGKSTLIKIISGFQQADRGGELYLNGQPYHVHSTLEAIRQGIQTVYQDLQVVPLASVAENIMLEKLSTRGKTGVLNWKEINGAAAKYLDLVGLKIDTSMQIGRLSIAQRQLVVIAKALSSNIKILMLDEPTASLSEGDAQHLFRVMDQLRKSGVLIIFVSHVLEEVLQVADRISVLRDGECVVTDEAANMDRRRIVRAMIGREEDISQLGVLPCDQNQKVLEVRNLTRDKRAYDISFDLHRGEILGFYGLVGAGRTELAKMIVGKDKYDSGEIRLNGKKVHIHSIHDAMTNHKLAYVTEDRRKDGLIMGANVKTNITITVWGRIANWFGYVPGRKEAEVSWKQVKDLEIKTYGLWQKVGNLSGGNQQKVNLAKWLAADADILIIDEPTVGVDVGAKEYFARLIWELAKKQKSIILISSDMPEMIKLAHRVLVFSGNRIVGDIDNSSKDYASVSQQISNCISEFQVAGS